MISYAFIFALVILFDSLRQFLNFLSSLVVVLIVGLVLLSPFLLIGFKIYRHHQRMAGRAKDFIATQKTLQVDGWTLIGSRPLQYIQNHHAYALFTRGKSQVLNGVAYKQYGDLTTLTFEYSYKIRYGKGSLRTVTQTVVGLQSLRLNLPYFTLYPEPPLGFIGETLGGSKDIDFSMYPVFSGRYALNSHDEPNARHFFNPQVLSFFESIPMTLFIDSGGTFLFIYVQEQIVSSEVLPVWVADAQKILRVFAH